jgi:hypothetical protein
MHPEFRRFSDEQVDAVVRPLLDELGLPPSYCISIRSLVRSRAQNWRSCCGGNCNPCIGKIEEAVDRTRQILLSSASTLPAGSDPLPVPGAPHPPHSLPAESAVPEELSPHGDAEDAEDRNWGLDYV